MRSILKRLIIPAFASVLVVIWSVDHQRSVWATRLTPITVTRIYTGPDGQTHAGEIDVKLSPLAGKFGTQWIETSDTVKVTGSQFMRWSPGYVNDWHPARQRQYLIALGGRGELKLAGGQKIPLVPGRILLAEDVTGKGHITRNLGKEECVFLLVHLADE